MAVTAARLSMSSGSTAYIHPFFERKASITSNSDDDNINAGRRKRRRTAEPDEKLEVTERPKSDSWYSQLMVAAKAGDKDGPRCTEKPVYRHDTSPKPRSRDSSDSVPVSCSPAVIAHAGRSSRLASPEPQSTARCPSNHVMNQFRDLTKPAQKVLSLNGDGTLRSQKAQSQGKPEGSRMESRIVGLKYGQEDRNIRLITGRKIDALRSGRIVAGNSNQGQQTAGESKPPKAPHPFFLPKVSRTGEDQPNGENLQTTSLSHKGVQCNDTIACSTPSKIRGIFNNARHEVLARGRPCKEILPTMYRKKPAALPGSIDPLWPPQDMLHVRPTVAVEFSSSKRSEGFNIPPSRKLKLRESHVERDYGVLRRLMRLVVRVRESDLINTSKSAKTKLNGFKIPARQILNGQQLHTVVNRNISLSCTQGTKPSFQHKSTHPATANLLQRIPGSTSAFDKFECEPQQWVDKYAPVQASQVLQNGSEAMVLRDWLSNSSVNRAESIVDGDARSGGVIVPKIRLNNARGKRRVKRKRKDLDDFIATSDEEVSHMDEVTDNEDVASGSCSEDTIKRSLVRSLDLASTASSKNRPTNSVVISGPHGCGKTAAVYAAAKELDFEIFEINAGTRRSGRDIIERVGDMTLNHLVHRADAGHKGLVSCKVIATAIPAHEPQKRPAPPKQEPVMESFFRPKVASSRGTRSEALVAGSSDKDNKVRRQRVSNSKQSLVLIEEVDVLFEEDKQFWSTIIDLTLHSKRPVVMTCTDEGLLPLDDLSLFAMLRFAPAPDEMAIDYLLCVAAMEGHILSSSAVGALYRRKGKDLRASISELNLNCQMAIGDEKCGLDWRLTGSSLPDDKPRANDILRAVSMNTYYGSIDCPSEGELSAELQSSGVLGLSSSALITHWEDYGIDASEQWGPLAKTNVDETFSAGTKSSISFFESLDRHLDALSVADSCCRFSIRDEEKIKIDASLPRLTESTSLHFTEDAPVLQAEPVIDVTGLSNEVSANMRETALRGLSMQFKNTVTDPEAFFQGLRSKKQSQKHSVSKNAQLLRTSLAPLSLPAKASLRPFSFSEIDHSSASTLAEDVAPYVRSILDYDIRLAEQRRQLELSLSRSEGQGHHTRKTRASRAALEGGNKSSTRREIWFEASMDVKAILNTRGSGWQEALQEYMAVSERNGEDVENVLEAPPSSCESAMTL